MSLYPQYAELKDNYEVLGASTTKTFTVPTGKRWIVFGGTATRATNATLDIAIYNSSDQMIMAFAQVGAGTTTISWGVAASALTLTLYQPLPLDAGSYVKYTWGAEQATPTVTCYITEHPK